MTKNVSKIGFLMFCIAFVIPNVYSQWRYPEADNIKDDIIITYEVKYDNELSEKQKQSTRFIKEFVVIFNGDKLLEKRLTSNVNLEISLLCDYKEELAYSCSKYGDVKRAIVSKFKKPFKQVTLLEGQEEQILGFPCQVSTTKIKGELRKIYTTKKFGIRFIKQFNTEGFLLKYSANDKNLGPYTVTARKILHTKVPESTYNLEGYNVRTYKEQKEYLASRKVKIKESEAETLEKIAGTSTKYVSETLELEKFKCKLSEEELKKVEQMIAFQSEYYEALFKVDIKKINIKLFGKLRAFRKFQKSISSTNSNTGFYSGRMKTIYVFKSDNFMRTIYHEINHAIARQVVNRIPAWINEGMAEFFEYFDVKSDRVSIKMQSSRLAKAKEWIKNDEVNLRTFLSYSDVEWRNKNLNPESYSYTVSYAFICYLYLRHPGVIGTILKYLKKGESSIKAIELATKQKIEELEIDFKNNI